MSSHPPRILVTGGSGYIAGVLIRQLLAAGWHVNTTVRDLKRVPTLRQLLGVGASEQLRCFAADLMADAGWAEAAAGCSHMAHLASPLPVGVPRDANELIVPPGAKLYRGTGCDTCRHTGYRGRSAIFEVCIVTEELRRKIIRKETGSALKAQAIEDGMESLRTDGMRRVLKGQTTVEEIVRVTQADEAITETPLARGDIHTAA